MDRDESRTDHVSAQQATGRLTDAPTVNTASNEIPASRLRTSNPITNNPQRELSTDRIKPRLPN